MKKYYITAGFMGSGSSAVTNLLNEIDGLSSPNGDFEYVFSHAPNGLFDLEDKLLVGNNALRSDEAIHSFLFFMHDLYAKKRYWVADYKNRVSPRFYEYAKELISDLNVIVLSDKSCFWHYMQNPNGIMTFLRSIRKIIYILTLKKVLITPPLKYKGMLLAYPTEEEFYSAAKKFVYRVIDDVKAENEGVILDQLLLPHNLFRLKNYFNDDVKVVLVDRDPRDVFISNKYFWTPDHVAIPFSTDVNDFCKQYQRMREAIQNLSDNRIVRIQFEDLIYDYDATVKKLYEDLEISPVAHKQKKEFFNPEISIVNTNLRKREPRFERESETIENKLNEYLYTFPQGDYTNVSGVKVF